MKTRYLVSVAVLLLGWMGLTQIVKAEGDTEIGFETEGETTLNKITIPHYQYTGECPGEEDGSIKTWFTSSEFVPMPKERVIIHNISRGISPDPEKQPFTDREYVKGRSSEEIDMKIGHEHNIQFFQVLPGVNTFEYEIRNGDTVIKRGKFKAEVLTIIVKKERKGTPVYPTKPGKIFGVTVNVPDTSKQPVVQCPDK